SRRKVAAIETALQERMNAKLALFHEGLPLVQRDRNAAYFAEPDGAQLLLCSEIGSEGRNFQFAHHLVLFDLPLSPGLIEQRIGRLDRIGQSHAIQIHVPVIPGTADEAVAAWYERGVDAFTRPLQGGEEFEERFRLRLLELADSYDGSAESRRELEALIEETAKFRVELRARLERGRDRLLELNSFDREVAQRVVTAVREADADARARSFLFDLLDHFGVRVQEQEGGDVVLDPRHAYIEAFPSIPPDGMLATFDRARALSREDISFLSADHPLLRDAMELLVNSHAGTTAFAMRMADKPNLLLEAVFILETVVDARWQVDRFLAPTPIRIVVDVRGEEVTEHEPLISLSPTLVDGDIHRFLEQRGFDRTAFRRLVENANERARTRGDRLIALARDRATADLGEAVQRLTDLRKVNDHVRPEEVVAAEERRARTLEALAAARLRLDSLRLILDAPRAATPPRRSTR
ncbi:MAG TPA: helicase-related protein, partial [Candidatus Synoicihabitans sp.]|nr:helicase-related protein [Candidatus Synoicihabitans sp.]